MLYYYTEDESEIEVNGGQVEKVEEFTFYDSTILGCYDGCERRTMPMKHLEC